jgi:hypothetical protein
LLKSIPFELQKITRIPIRPSAGADVQIFFSSVEGLPSNVISLFGDTTQAPKSLEQFYTLIQSEKINGFLNENRFLYFLLIDLYAAVNSYFPKPKMALKFVVGYEGDEDAILVNIHTSLPEEESFQRFEDFRFNWWLDNLDRAKSKLLVTVVT